MPRTVVPFIAWVGLLTLAALVSNCATPPPEPSEVVIALPGLPLTLMPHARSESLTSSYLSNMFEGLAGFDRDMKLVPLLAVSWENPDALTWLFRLRRGVTFHDGTPLTADDVVFSILRARNDPASALRSNCADIATVTREGDDVVRVTTTRPLPVLLQKLRVVFILPRRRFEREGADAFARRPVGTGPYRFVAETAGQEIRLAAYDGYWGGPSGFTAVRFVRFQSGEEAESLLRSGRVDLAANIPPPAATALATRPLPGLEVIRNRSLMVLLLGMDTRVPPFDDIRLRRALALAVDRPALVTELRHGYASPANQLVPPAVFGFIPDLPEFPYEPAGARRLLVEAGHPDGIDVTLLLPVSRRSLAEALQRQMAPAGIRLRLDAREREAFWPLADTAPFFLMGVASTTGDASDVFEDMIHSTTELYGRDNHGRFAVAELDRLIESLNGYWARTQRLDALQQVMARVMAEVPRVPLITEDLLYARSAHIDYPPRVDNYVLAHEIGRRP